MQNNTKILQNSAKIMQNSAKIMQNSAKIMKNSVKNILPKLSIYLILIVATVFSIGKLSYTVASKTHRHDMIHDVIGNKSIGLLLTEKVFPFLSYPWDTSIGWLFELGARVSFLSLIFLILYLP